MKKFLLFSIILVIFSCKSKRINDNKYFIENLAEIANVEKIKNIYSDAQVREGSDQFEEDTQQQAYNILYPDTDNEALLIWKDEARTRLHSVMVEKDGHWKSKSGIMIGTSYEDLVRLNGKPIKIYGFGWDYSGAVDWNGGNLTDSNIRVFLAPKSDPPNRFYSDGIIEPSQVELEAMDLRVKAIIYRKPNNFMTFNY